MKKRELKKLEYSEGEILISDGDYLNLIKDGKEYKRKKVEIVLS